MSIQSVLGFDHGKHRIGVAIGQIITQTANPLENINTKNKQVVWTRIQSLAKIWLPDALVVGIPWRSDGTESHSTKGAKNFAKQLQNRFDLPVYTIDETLSSHAAADLIDGDIFSGAPLDAMAAKIIVETWLVEYANQTDHAL
jgi:putative Holliday junction resolvase